ncbi:hypothetical protein [uncultured Gammaproteobacteria bacterium]|nr:hypothetical protein [uncultured Gammaproteobacteria bacterium]
MSLVPVEMMKNANDINSTNLLFVISIIMMLVSFVWCFITPKKTKNRKCAKMQS